MDMRSNEAVDASNAEHQEARAAYLSIALATGDGYFSVDALGAIACAYGIDKVAERLGIAPQELIDCFDSGRDFDVRIFLKIAAIVGLTLSATCRSEPDGGDG